jgi:hypothetical protein
VPKSKKNDTPAAPHDVAAIRQAIKSFFDWKDDKDRKPCGAKCGVYAFYDYDGEPIYVGQTYERIRERIGRHLTNQRSDAVAMNVLDPFEVAEIEVYPFYNLEKPEKGEAKEVYIARIKRMLDRAEFTLHQKVLKESVLGAVLNEGEISEAEPIALPPSHRSRIIPEDLFPLRKHPDVRIARRASTIAALARVISERDVSAGLRRTLLTQARRLERLSAIRFKDFEKEVPKEPTGGELGAPDAGDAGVTEQE